MAEWQPIETAPRDGTRVLLFGTERVFLPNRAFVGRWDAERSGGSWVGPEWRCIPTHWMPLPEPPSVLPLAEGGGTMSTGRVPSAPSYPAEPEPVPVSALAGGYLSRGVAATLVLGLTACAPWPETYGPPCPYHLETRTRPDDRPHKQGGRGGTISYQVRICDMSQPPDPNDYKPRVPRN